MNKRNYQKELDEIIANLDKEGKKPHLLLHCCCAPCSSYVLEYLTEYFYITVLFYNPNISPKEEYEKRKAELKRLISEAEYKNDVDICDCDYNSDSFFTAIKGFEDAPEGGERCEICFNLRLGKAAEMAKKSGFEYFASTLSISPLKNADTLNRIGEELAEKCNIKHLPNDFKKREGYKRSIELSRKYNLYRQNYCGCIFSKNVDNTIYNRGDENEVSRTRGK